MTPIKWYALDATGRILEQCEAPDIQAARLIFSEICREAKCVQSRPSWLESRHDASIPKRRMVKEDEDGS